VGWARWAWEKREKTHKRKGKQRKTSKKEKRKKKTDNFPAKKKSTRRAKMREKGMKESAGAVRGYEMGEVGWKGGGGVFQGAHLKGRRKMAGLTRQEMKGPDKNTREVDKDVEAGGAGQKEAREGTILA